MDERQANIDLAFRNGLKDYEVLPPSDVWNSINGKLTQRSRPLYLMRAAAFLAIAMTLSGLAYLWIGRNAALIDPRVMASNEESYVPSKSAGAGKPVLHKKSLPEETITALKPIENHAETVAIQPDLNNTSPDIILIPETNLRLPLKTISLNNSLQHRVNFRNTAAIDLGSEKIGYDYIDYSAENSSGKTERWSISALASPTYYSKFSTGSDELSKQLKASEQAVVSYTGGVALTYSLNKRFSIQSGLFYSSVGQEVEGINSFAGFRKYDNTKGANNFEVLTTNGKVLTSNADVFLMADGSPDRIITAFNRDVFDPQKASLDYINNTMRQNFSYLELPVYLKYKFIDRAVDFNLIGGFSYNLLSIIRYIRLSTAIST